MTKHNEKYYIKSAHPYDETEYTFAISKTGLNGTYRIYDYKGSYINDLSTVMVDTGDGWQETLEIMQKLDSEKKARIARD